MTTATDLKEIRKDLSNISTDLAIVKTNLTNHLKHHYASKIWVQWAIPLSISAFMLIDKFL